MQHSIKIIRLLPNFNVFVNFSDMGIFSFPYRLLPDITSISR